jgi:methionyl-tRNA formyltransferase
LRIVFLGTPEFAVPTLDALAKEHEIVLVVAQPDKPAGRGLKMHAPAVAVHARELHLPLLQPPKIREGLDAIAAVKPDIGIVVAYGKILPPALLAIPRHGFLNVHGSILPKYRGAAPIQRAIERGESVTGVTIMRVDEQLDHGPMLAVATTPIGPHEHSPAVAERLSKLGADAMASVLRDFDRRVETPQDDTLATLAPKMEKQEGEIRWSDTTASIYNRFRAFDPWPGIHAGDLKLTNVRPASASGAPGSILRIGEGVIVATGDGAIELLEVQRAGKGRVRATEFAHGAGWQVGKNLC